jgi:putative cell wall-binding protein
MTSESKTKSSANWSARVTRESNALDLEEGVFTWADPKKIAKSLQRSAEKSTRRKSSPYRSAMSMLTFYMNRAGKNLTREQVRVLEQAKSELRKLYAVKTTESRPK